MIINESNGRFNLNSSLQSDRASWCLSYEESLLAAQVHYKIWESIFAKYKVDLMYHEPCSHFFNHIAALLCKNQGGKYYSFIQSRPENSKYAYLAIEGDNYNATEIESAFQRYMKSPETIDIERCKLFLTKFRSDYSVFFSDKLKSKISTFSIWKMKMRERFGFSSKKKYVRELEPFEYWASNRKLWKAKYANWKAYKSLNIHFEMAPPKGEKYYYYSIHLEPEAVVLYWGGGIYNNQVKLIENIAASLPAGCYLYVKDHPHEFAYRKADDYERLQKVPNIRLIHQSIPGKQLIKNAIGVFSINGTAGFEAILLGKQAYCFGHNYYSFLTKVNYIENIKDLRRVIYSNINRQYSDDTELYAFVNAYLDASHPGYADFATNSPLSFIENQVENAKAIAMTFENLLNY